MLHLRVAIRAQQDALADLGTYAGDAPSRAFLGHAELLDGWVEVMKLQGGQTPVVTAEGAEATGLSDKDLLDLAPTTHDGLLSASATAEIATRFPNVFAGSVAWTKQNCSRQARVLGLARTALPGRTELIPRQPVTDCALAAPERLGDLSD